MSHVLIIDDEPSICWGFKEFLTEDGHDVCTVSSAEEGLQAVRSEEHTSELQSRRNLVCRLLLEKKKKNKLKIKIPKSSTT